MSRNNGDYVYHHAPMSSSFKLWDQLIRA